MVEEKGSIAEILNGMRLVRPYFRKLFSCVTDLSNLEVLILSLLDAEPEGRMFLSDLQKKLTPIRASKLTNITNKLEDEGYIVKDRSKEDRRKVIIRITQKGRKLYRDFEDAVAEAVTPGIEKLTPEELEILKKSFDVWLKVLEDI